MGALQVSYLPDANNGLDLSEVTTGHRRGGYYRARCEVTVVQLGIDTGLI